MFQKCGCFGLVVNGIEIGASCFDDSALTYFPVDFIALCLRTIVRFLRDCGFDELGFDG